jgi:hypothetical protein
MRAVCTNDKRSRGAGMNFRWAFIAAATIVATTPAVTFASPVEFDWSGSETYVSGTGVIIIDDSVFNGSSSQFLSFSQMLDVSFSMTNTVTSQTWSYADMEPGPGFVFDSSTAARTIVAQSGGYYSNKDLLAGYPTPGSIFSNLGLVNGTWTYAGPTDVRSVPEPATPALFATALLALGLTLRNKRQLRQ